MTESSIANKKKILLSKILLKNPQKVGTVEDHNNSVHVEIATGTGQNGLGVQVLPVVRKAVQSPTLVPLH